MIVIGIAALLFITSNPVGSEPVPCPGFEGEQASRIDADTFYIQRVLSILSAASREDATILSSLVAGDARFEIWRGDYTSSAREVGPAGAIQMVRDVNPLRFEAQSAATGPIRFIPTQCSWEITVLFRSDQPSQGVSIHFSFRDGILASATGSGVALIEGNVR